MHSSFYASCIVVENVEVEQFALFVRSKSSFGASISRLPFFGLL